MHRLNLQVSPRENIIVPNSDGYSVYSALLAVLENYDPEISATAHDEPVAPFHNSGLIGSFSDAEPNHHKTIDAAETYTLTIGLPRSDDALTTAFRETLVDGDATIPVNDGELVVESASVDTTTHEKIMRQADRVHNPDLRFNFKSPVCIEEAEKVTTLFPHRLPVFTDLIEKWNQTAPEDLQFGLPGDRIVSEVVEKSKGHIPTYNVVVNRIQNSDGEQNIFSHGFGGGVTYTFRGASKDTQKKVTALSLFAAYSGIGIATARGCGNVQITVE